MSHQQRLLEGDVVESDDVSSDASEVNRLRDDLRRVRGECDALRAENVRLRQRMNQVDAPAAQLRKTLEPLYRALQAMWGDIELIDPQVQSAAPEPPQHSGGGDNKASPIWQSWKQKLGGQCAKVIDVLLTHREMNTTQLAIAIGTRRQNIPSLIYKLNQAGLINKNGGQFSLKSLG